MDMESPSTETWVDGEVWRKTSGHRHGQDQFVVDGITLSTAQPETTWREFGAFLQDRDNVPPLRIVTGCIPKVECPRFEDDYLVWDLGNGSVYCTDQDTLQGVIESRLRAAGLSHVATFMVDAPELYFRTGGRDTSEVYRGIGQVSFACRHFIEKGVARNYAIRSPNLLRDRDQLEHTKLEFYLNTVASAGLKEHLRYISFGSQQLSVASPAVQQIVKSLLMQHRLTVVHERLEL